MAKATKKANGDGTLSKRLKDGKLVGWKGAVSVGYKADGKPDRRWVSGKTRDEVKAKMTALEGQKRTGTLTAYNAGTVGELLERWIKGVESKGRAKSTLSDYGYSVKKLTEHLGAVRLDKLSVLEVERTVNVVLEKNGIHEARRVLARLRQALNQAMKWQLIARNLAQLVEMPSPQTRQVAFWEPHEAARFLEHARAHRLYAAFYLALTLGMRSGELRGLRFSDVDFERGWLHIRQQATEDKSGVITLESTLKTENAARSIKLEGGILEVLSSHQKLQQSERYTLEHPHAQLEQRRKRDGITRTYQDMGLVFATEVGTPISSNNFRREFKALCEGAGVKSIRVHDLRHTAATAMIRHGFGARLAADILGHADTRTTLGTYAHVWKEQKEENAPSAAKFCGHSSVETPLN